MDTADTPQENARATCHPWHALYTRHRHEKAAARVLVNKRFDVFLPLYTTEHRWQDRVKEVALPLFPSYLFLRGGLDRWPQIITTPGVCEVVRCGGQPAVIPVAEIEAIRRLLASSLRVEPHPFLKRGDWVRIKWGPLTGLEGILVRQKQVSRLVLSIEMLGKSAAVEVDVSAVERITARAAGFGPLLLDRRLSTPSASAA